MTWEEMAACGRIATLVVLLVAFGAGCKSPGESAWPDSGVQGPCPDGFLFVERGTFEKGVNPDDDFHGIDIQLHWNMMPRRTVMLSDYCIQKTEVTVAAFRECINSGLCTRGVNDRSYNHRCNLSDGPEDDRGDHPMNCVSWEAARQFCSQWPGGDLPTDAQWEKAARGTDRRLFPWGNDSLSCDRANWDADGPYNEEDSTGGNLGCLPYASPATWPVGYIPHKGDSPYGLKDMAGNVGEWVLDCYGDLGFSCADGPCVDPGEPCEGGANTTRGGYAESYHVWMFSVVTHSIASDSETRLGFRCVALPQSSRSSGSPRR